MKLGEFRDLVLIESIQFLFEADDEISSMEEMLKSSELELKRKKEYLDAETAYLSKLKDLDLKKASNIKIQELKGQIKEAQANVDAIKKVLEAKKTVAKNVSKETDVPGETTTLNITSSQVAEATPTQMPAHKKIIKKAPIKQSPVQPTNVQPTKKTYVVKFDQNTEAPYSVSFSQRGFLIGDTRLSFELLEKALSKGFTITLNNGFVLSPIRMQKILKYKDRF